MSATLVQRLRDSVTQCRALDRSALLEEAAAEIERLRGSPVTNPMLKEKRAEVLLTDAERDAIEGAILHMEARGVWAWPATLRGLLERLK